MENSKRVQPNPQIDMKVFISVDMEGISGIVDTTMTSRSQPDYNEAEHSWPKTSTPA